MFQSRIFTVFVCFILLTVGSSITLAQNKEKEQVLGNQLSTEQLAISLTTLDGQTTTLHDLVKDKVVFVNFWAFWCHSCAEEMPSLQKLYNHYKDNPKIIFIFAAIDGGETVEQVKHFLKDQNLDLPVYVVKVSETHTTFTGSGIPITYIFDCDKQILIKTLDSRDWDQPDVYTLIEKAVNQPKK